MDDLVAFVRRCLDEDEREARNLLAVVQQVVLELKEPKLLGRHMPGWALWPDVEKMAQDRLAEVEAKRRLLDYLVDLDSRAASNNWWSLDTDEPIKLLAQPYAGRDGWREEWRM